jgi:hypothetical protein
VTRPAPLPWSHDRWLLAATLLLAALSFWIATRNMSHSLWLDESLTDMVARQSTVSDVTAAAMRERAYPPLFFLVVHYVLPFRSDETGMRLPAAAFGALAILAVFLLGKALADGLTGALAALLFVLTPGVFRYFVDGNAYTLLVLETTLSTLYLVRAIRSDRVSDWLGYALFALLGLATHTFFVLYFGAQFFGGLYLRLSGRRVASASFRRFLTVTSALFLAEIVWVILYLHLGGERRTFHLSRCFEIKTLISTAAMYVGPLSMGYVVRLAPWALLQFVGGAMFFIERRRTFWFFVISATIPLVAITLFLRATVPFVAYKYGLGVFPLACILAAYSLKAPGGSGSRWRLVLRGCTLAAIAVYCVTGAAVLIGADTRTFEFQDWKGAARYLASHATRNDAIALSYRYGLPCLGYYYKGPARFYDAEQPGEAAGLVSRLLSEPGPPDRAVWVVILSLANEDSLAARYTESGKRGLDTLTQMTLAALRERGLSVNEAARFHRISVLLVRPTPLARGAGFSLSCRHSCRHLGVEMSLDAARTSACATKIHGLTYAALH